MSETLTALDVVQRSATFLEGKGVENARLNAEWLIAAALGLDRMRLYMQFDRPLTETELATMRGYVARRAKREPLQYILGTVPFHEIVLKVDRRALIPRPETEQLVELVANSVAANDLPLRVLDLGTGTGAIALALAFAWPRSSILAVDRSEEALALAGENAFFCGLQNRVEYRVSDWFSQIRAEERFDVIVSNPPYLTEEEMGTAQPEVRDFEPRGALLAPEKGLADLRTILVESYGRLSEGGCVWLETGIAHREPLLALAGQLGYRTATGFDDWSGRARFVQACR